MKKITCTLSLIVILFANCAKDNDDNGTASKTQKDYLISDKWYYKAITVNPAYDWYNTGTPITDVYAQPQTACAKDNILTFYSDGRYEEDEGATKCNASLQQVHKDFWFFTNQEKDISIDGTISNIVQLDASTFIIKKTDVKNGQTYTTTITLKH